MIYGKKLLKTGSLVVLVMLIFIALECSNPLKAEEISKGEPIGIIIEKSDNENGVSEACRVKLDDIVLVPIEEKSEDIEHNKNELGLDITYNDNDLTSMYLYNYIREQNIVKENILNNKETTSDDKEDINLYNFPDYCDSKCISEKLIDYVDDDGILTYLFPKMFAKAKDCGKAYLTPAYQECCRENMKNYYMKQVAEKRAYSIPITREMYCKFISLGEYTAEGVCFGKAGVFPDIRIVPVACGIWLGLMPLDLNCAMVSDL